MSDSIQRTSVGDFPISQTVTVPASTSLVFVSGTLPDLADPKAPAGTPAAYGNTEVQTVSVFNKLRRILQQQDLDLGDIVQLRVFLVGAEETAGKPLQVDLERAGQLVAAAESVAGLIKQPAALNPLEVLAWPGVLVADANDPQVLNNEALKLFNDALTELKSGRGREGADLARLLDERLSSIVEEVATLRTLVPQMLATQRQKVLDRFADMKAELDPQRLEQEMVLLAQKSDVAEELDRLSTHVTEVRRVLKAGGQAGRRLDFLMQELNREANTLGSKAFDPRSTQAAVNLKVLIEQMREQVQNIE